MRLWILSDLHLEFEWFPVPSPIPSADVAIFAGDILTKGVVPSIRWLAENLPSSLPIIFVAGNHEFYRGFLQDGIANGRIEAAKHRNIHFLEDDVIDLFGTRFLGASLWTDFMLYGAVEAGMNLSRNSINDYRLINYSKTPFARLDPNHTARKHALSREFFERELRGDGDRPKVVVSHHAPSLLSVADEYKLDPLTSSFASDLDPMIKEYAPSLWVHGHVHHRVDYMLGKTRVLANPRGYPNEPSFRLFDPAFVVEV